jgi:hypothetical protein
MANSRCPYLAEPVPTSALATIQEKNVRFRFLVAIGSIIAASPRPLTAQQTTPAGDAKAPQPSAEMHTLIKALAGHWSLKVKFEPSKESPQGLESAGEESWHASAGGVTFTDEEVFAAGPQTVIVVGILWQDATSKAFHAMDCSNQNSHTCDLKGAASDVVAHWTGTKLTIDEKELSNGKMMTSRVEWSDITANSFTETGSLAPPGGPFQTAMTIHATRTTAQ